MRDLTAAKRKEIETRLQLGPRLGRSRSADTRPTAPPKTPRATGAPAQAMRSSTSL